MAYQLEFQLFDGKREICSSELPETFLTQAIKDFQFDNNKYVIIADMFTTDEYNKFIDCIQGKNITPKSLDRLIEFFKFMNISHNSYIYQIKLSDEQIYIRKQEQNARNIYQKNKYVPNILEPVYIYSETNSKFIHSFTPTYTKHNYDVKIIQSITRQLKLVSKLKASYFVADHFLSNTYFYGPIFDDDHELSDAHLILAGGFVLACITHTYYSDIDVFLVGVKRDLSESESKTVIDFILNKISTNLRLLGIVRTECAITFKCTKKNNMYNTQIILIQLILKGYTSLQHVLIGFDIDCCCFGYDGDEFYMLPRGRRFLQNIYTVNNCNVRVNIVDHERRSLTYEQRLIKYCNRGIGIMIVYGGKISLDRICSKDKSELCGIERLIHWNWYGNYLLDNDYVTSGGKKCKFLDNQASYNNDTSVDFQYTWFKTNNIIPWFVVSDNSFDICSKHEQSNFDKLKICINQKSTSFNPVHTDDWFAPDYD